MNDTAIKVENLSKRYRIGLEEELPDTLVGAVTQAVKQPLRNWRRLRRLTRFDKETTTNDDRPTTNGQRSSSVVRRSSDVRSDVDRDTLWALKDVSFEVKRGEVVGIIGRNGAGKSTLLKILARITHPTSGRAVINGRVGSLLEVGTGFHPELTGRENIYLNGTILGMTKAEVDRKFDEIVDFSGVEKFIDTPVKRYSSGMRVRLAFSVAAHLDPEILLVDEVLAVGDAAFQQKCLGKMEDVAGEGRTVLFVSHNMAAINNLTLKTIWLENGGLKLFAATSNAVESYVTSSFSNQASDHLYANSKLHGSRRAIISKVEICDNAGNPISSSQIGKDIIVRLTGNSPEPQKLEFVIAFFNSLGIRVFTVTNKQVLGNDIEIDGDFTVECILPKIKITEGRYGIRVAVYGSGKIREEIDPACYVDIVDRGYYGTTYRAKTRHGVLVQNSKWVVKR